MGFLSDIFDPGRKDRRKASKLAEQGIIKGGSFSGPGGLSGGFDFSNGVGSITSSLGSWAPMLEQLQASATARLSDAGSGLDPGFTAAADSTINKLGNFDISRLQNMDQYNALGQAFNTNMNMANRDVFDVGSEISSRLRALSERSNQRLVNKTFDRLKASGKLGTSGGAGIAGELDYNLGQMGLQQDLAGIQFGQSEVQRAFGNAMAALGGREQIAGRNFNEQMGVAGLEGSRALQQFGINQQMFQNLLAQQAQGGQLGMGLMSGAMGLSQLPLAFLQAAQGATGQASNSLFAASGINQNNAQMAKSPFLEALNAAGSFMSSIAPGGFFTPQPGGE